MTDTEILERLIYRAYIAPDPHAPLEAEALLPDGKKWPGQETIEEMAKT